MVFTDTQTLLLNAKIAASQQKRTGRRLSLGGGGRAQTKVQGTPADSSPYVSQNCSVNPVAHRRNNRSLNTQSSGNLHGLKSSKNLIPPQALPWKADSKRNSRQTRTVFPSQKKSATECTQGRS